jgi:formamidopyrimidine-DNA glycosylase
MPEGPEVLEYYNFIKEFFYDNTLCNIEIVSGKYIKKELPNFDIFKQSLPCKINDITIKGKTIFIKFDNKYGLVITHGMSGYWSDENEKHSRIKFELKNDNLYYVDPRNFGSIIVCLNDEEFYFRENKLGPYIFDKNMSYELFYSRLDKKPKTKIAIALLDQNLLSGIGNYLRCDILWYSKINGEKRIEDLSDFEKMVLYKSAINICKYHAGMKHFLKITPNDYNRDFFIYMEDEDIYGKKVHTKKLNGRTFHYTC